MPTNQKSGNKKGVTVRDVIVHMQHMERRLSKKIDQNSRDIRDVETRLAQRIDALDEDLTATMKDSLQIRRHVGMAIPEDE